MPIVEGSGPKWVKYDCQRMPQDGKPTGGNRLHTDEALIPWWGKSAVNESFQKSVVAHCPVDDVRQTRQDRGIGITTVPLLGSLWAPTGGNYLFRKRNGHAAVQPSKATGSVLLYEP